MRLANVLLLGSLALLAACSGGGYGTQPPPPPPGPPPAPTPTNAVNVRDNYFDPAAAGVSPGTRVTWTWRGNIEHSVTFEDGQGSSAIQGTGELNRTFATAGTYRYRCMVHSSAYGGGMAGSVVVQ